MNNNENPCEECLLLQARIKELEKENLMLKTKAQIDPLDCFNNAKLTVKRANDGPRT